MLKVRITIIISAIVLGALYWLRPDLRAAASAPASPSDSLPADALQNASSVYLRGAAAGPLRWQPYNDASFALARKLNRPLLIDIGAMWCHWCHVMDDKTYADPEVVQLINQHFVPIKVDRDQRPDVDQYYQAAAAELSGNGGWPLTCFTMPDGALFAAFGFLPPRPAQSEQQPADTMVAVLNDVAKTYKAKRKDLGAWAEGFNEKFKKASALKASGENKSGLVEILAGLGNAYDHANGGFSFGDGPKFYEFPALEFALTVGFYGHRDFTSMALKTLRKMARGGVYDQLGGGFHRYSTDQAWQVPHFEKMGYDQALALSAYSHAYEISGDPGFREVALGVASYVASTLLNPANKTFYSAQDADAFAGDDGGYYTWTKPELQRVLKPAELAAAALYFGLERQPATAPDGRLVLQRELSASQVAQQLRIPPQKAQQLIGQAVQKLNDARKRRRAPAVDPAVLVDRNALMDSGFLAAAQAFGEAKLGRIAVDNLDYLYAHARLADGSYCHDLRDGPCVNGLAADQVYMLDAWLAAYQVSGQEHELGRAQEIARVILKEFRDPDTGVIKNQKPPENQTVLERWAGGVEPFYDAETPSLQGVAARDFAMLAVLAPGSDYLKDSGALLARAPLSPGAALMLATVGRALAERTHGDALVVVKGSRADRQTTPLLRAAQFAYRPGKVLAWMQPASSSSPAQSADGIGPLTAQHLIARNNDSRDAFAFICAGDVCTNPVSSARDLSRLIGSFVLESPDAS